MLQEEDHSLCSSHELHSDAESAEEQNGRGLAE